MATICSISVAPSVKTLNSIRDRKLPAHFLISKSPRRLKPSIRGPRTQAAKSSPTAEERQKSGHGSMSIDALQRFINLNLGNWTGSFYQFDSHGNLMNRVNTRLAVSSYGEDELISLIQTLYIQQPPSSTSISGYTPEPEWAEYKIKEMNMFTVDKYQQIGFFPNERAFSLRYQTAGMLETVLRQGVLGEDDFGEESPKNLKLPSPRPSVVCENCLYSMTKDMRARAFHIMDPKGVLEMLFIFLEERGDGVSFPPSLENTKDISSTSIGGDVTTNVHWTGTLSDNLITFDGGFQITLLPGDMYMGCPCDLAKNVAESKSFHLEFCWLESPGKRQKLVRTYDVDGLVVSSTYVIETKL